MTTLCDNDLYFEFFPKIYFDIWMFEKDISEKFRIIYLFEFVDLLLVLIDTSRGLRQQIYLQYIYIIPISCSLL